MVVVDSTMSFSITAEVKSFHNLLRSSFPVLVVFWSPIPFVLSP